MTILLSSECVSLSEKESSPNSVSLFSNFWFILLLKSKRLTALKSNMNFQCKKVVVFSFFKIETAPNIESNFSHLLVLFFVVVDYSWDVDYSWKTFSIFTFRYYNQLRADIRQWRICRSSRPVPCTGCGRAFSVGAVLPRLHSRLGGQHIPQQMWWQT